MRMSERQVLAPELDSSIDLARAAVAWLDRMLRITFVALAPYKHALPRIGPSIRTLLPMRERSNTSYRSDARVPEFGDHFPIALMDVDCALCCFGARMIDRLDRSDEIRICPLQSVLGQGLINHYGLRIDNRKTWLLMELRKVLGDFEAMIRVGERSGGWGRALSLLRIVPRALRSRIYAGIARSGYRWFGRRDLCALPVASLRARLLCEPS